MELTSVPDPAVMDRWHKGRSTYCVWMYRLDDETLMPVIRSILTSLTGVEILPIQNTHMTVFVSGFKVDSVIHNDDISSDKVNEQISVMSDTQLHKPRLRATGVGFDKTSIYLNVEDATKTTDLARDVLGNVSFEISFGQFTPHITLGHYMGNVELKDIARKLEPWSMFSAPVEMTQSEIELVAIEATVPIRKGIGLCKDIYTNLHTHVFQRQDESHPLSGEEDENMGKVMLDHGQQSNPMRLD